MKQGSFVIGLVIGAILAAAVMFSVYYVPRKGISFGLESLPFYVIFDEAHGLRAGSPVLISGIEAGEITAISIESVAQRGWKVMAQVEVFDGEQFGPMLTVGSAYAAVRSGILGEVTLAITPGGPGATLQAGDLVDGKPPQDFGAIVGDLGHLVGRFADFMDGRQPGDPSLRRAFTDLQRTLRNLSDFSEKLP